MSGIIETLFGKGSMDYLMTMMAGVYTAIVASATDLYVTVLSFLTIYGKLSYEFIVPYALIVSETLKLEEWWGLEHTVLFIWLVLFVPAFCKRSSGHYQEILLQLVCGLSILLLVGCFLQLITGIQGGKVFGGKFKIPTMGIFAAVVMMFGAIINGIKKEIYGYGVSDLPADERCALVFDSIKKFIGFETAIFLTIATFGLPAFNLKANHYDYTPWLCAFPIIGMLRAMNTYFAPEVEERVVSGIATDLNGLPPQAKEDEGNYILTLPWKYIIDTVICLGTKAALTYCIWHLTEDRNVFALPIIDLVIPYLIAKAKEWQWLTDNAGHLIYESAILAAACIHYYLFRTYIQQGTRTCIPQVGDETTSPTTILDETQLFPEKPTEGYDILGVLTIPATVTAPISVLIGLPALCIPALVYKLIVPGVNKD